MRFQFGLLLISLCIIIMNCNPGNDTVEVVGIARKIVPQIEQTSQDAEDTEIMTDDQELPEQIQPLIRINQSDTLLQVTNANLDLENTEEQILVVKDKEDAYSFIRIIIADYDSNKDYYVPAFEYKTNAVNIRTFNITLNDLIGDHTMEIVCRGTDNQGNLTLDVIKISPLSHLSTNSYYPICKLTTDGLIEIQEEERTQDYQLGLSNGESFSIMCIRSDPESEKLEDTAKEIYKWDSFSEYYLKTSEEKISGIKAEETELKNIYESKIPENYENHIKGFWQKQSQTEEVPSVNGHYIWFNPELREVVFFSGDIQEIYIWEYSQRFLHNGLRVLLKNRHLQSIEKRLNITLPSLNNVSVTISANDEWNGQYIKLDNNGTSPFTKVEADKNSMFKPATLSLSGLFSNQSKLGIIFNKPYFTWFDDINIYTGSYSIFSTQQEDADINVLFLKIKNQNNQAIEDKTYIIECSQEYLPGCITKKIILTPAIVGIKGIDILPGSEIILEQAVSIREDI